MYRIAVQADMFCTLNLHSDMHFPSVVESKAFFSPMLVIIEAWRTPQRRRRSKPLSPRLLRTIAPSSALSYTSMLDQCHRFAHVSRLLCTTMTDRRHSTKQSHSQLPLRRSCGRWASVTRHPSAMRRIKRGRTDGGKRLNCKSKLLSTLYADSCSTPFLHRRLK